MLDLTTITATLEHIRWSNGEGFLIGSFFSESTKTFTAVGSILNAQPAMTYKLFGAWKTHPKFGWQFQFDRYESVQPSDEDGIYRYLVRVVKYVGPSIAEKLIVEYDANTLDVLREDPCRVAQEIPGISLKKAKEIQAELIENERDEKVLVELMGILTLPGMRKSLPYDLIEDYGSDAVEKLKTNPYIIVDYPGTGFLMADRLGVQVIKIDPDSGFRMKAAIDYAMNEDLQGQGNTWIHRDGLKAAVKELISTALKFDSVIEKMIEIGLIVNRDGWLATKQVDIDENLIVKKIREGLCP